jgi:hypothetical protein
VESRGQVAMQRHGHREVANALGAPAVEPMFFRFETTDGEVVIQFGCGSGQLHGGVD